MADLSSTGGRINSAKSEEGPNGFQLTRDDIRLDLNDGHLDLDVVVFVVVVAVVIIIIIIIIIIVVVVVVIAVVLSRLDNWGRAEGSDRVWEKQWPIDNSWHHGKKLRVRHVVKMYLICGSGFVALVG